MHFCGGGVYCDGVIDTFFLCIHRAIGMNYFTEEMLEMMDPTIMFAIPRLSIIL